MRNSDDDRRVRTLPEVQHDELLRQPGNAKDHCCLLLCICMTHIIPQFPFPLLHASDSSDDDLSDGCVTPTAG